MAIVNCHEEPGSTVPMTTPRVHVGDSVFWDIWAKHRKAAKVKIEFKDPAAVYFTTRGGNPVNYRQADIKKRRAHIAGAAPPIGKPGVKEDKYSIIFYDKNGNIIDEEDPLIVREEP